jgi:hypothetical protein
LREEFVSAEISIAILPSLENNPSLPEDNLRLVKKGRKC